MHLAAQHTPCALATGWLTCDLQRDGHGNVCSAVNMQYLCSSQKSVGVCVRHRQQGRANRGMLRDWRHACVTAASLSASMQPQSSKREVMLAAAHLSSVKEVVAHRCSRRDQGHLLGPPRLTQHHRCNTLSNSQLACSLVQILMLDAMQSDSKMHTQADGNSLFYSNSKSRQQQYNPKSGHGTGSR